MEKLIAKPVDIKDSTSPWITGLPAELESLEKIRGPSNYVAHLGVNSGGANGVYWVRIVDRAAGNLLVENAHDIGKKKLKQITVSLEADYLYPLYRSGDVDRWFAKSELYMVVPHTEKTDWVAIPESVMKTRYPKTYGFLSNFKSVLLSRSAYKLLRPGHAFYILVDIHSHSFTPYKVAWKRMGSRIDAAVLPP